MKALDNRFYVEFMQLEIGLLPLENIWSNSTCNSKYGVSSTQVPSSIAVVVKNFKIA